MGGMEIIVQKQAVSLLPILLLIGAVVLGLLCLAGGRRASRVAGIPFIALLAGALLLAWLRWAF